MKMIKLVKFAFKMDKRKIEFMSDFIFFYLYIMLRIKSLKKEKKIQSRDLKWKELLIHLSLVTQKRIEMKSFFFVWCYKKMESKYIYIYFEVELYFNYDYK